MMSKTIQRISGFLNWKTLRRQSKYDSIFEIKKNSWYFFHPAHSLSGKYQFRWAIMRI